MPSRHRRPAHCGSGPAPGPPRQDGLDARTDAGGPGGGLLGSARDDGDGMLNGPTPHGPQAAARSPALPLPERPRRRLSNRNSPTVRCPPYESHAATKPRASSQAGRPAELPTQPTERVVARRPPGVPPYTPADGRSRARRVRQLSGGRAPWSAA